MKKVTIYRVGKRHEAEKKKQDSMKKNAVENKEGGNRDGKK